LNIPRDIADVFLKNFPSVLSSFCPENFYFC
jgi:hypothetical protein